MNASTDKPKGKPRGRKGGRPSPQGTPTIKKSIQLTPAEWTKLSGIHPTPSQAVRKLLEINRA